MTSSWTDARETELRLMCASPERPSAGDMGIQLGVSRNTIIGKVARLGLMLPNHGSYNSHSGGRPRKSPERKTRFYAPPTQPEPTPEPIDPPIPFDGKGVTLFELWEGTCRFPIGDPADPSFFFCGRQPHGASPYCRLHHVVCYQPHQPPRRAFIPARKTPA